MILEGKTVVVETLGLGAHELSQHNDVVAYFGIFD